ncbi:MAG: diguanylate cyclase, partial [Rhodospirillales bacterium]|nr:diguanylate cyclase [Rhodospirillales bacterium]
MTPPRLVQNRQAPPSIADAAQKLRHVFVRDLVLPARIGVRPHELAASQRIRINVDLAVHEG